MKPPTQMGNAMYAPTLPPVQPLPGGNQYGGFPVNPFAGQGPVAPSMVGMMPAKMPANPAINMGFVNPKFTPLNPVENKPATGRPNQLIDLPRVLPNPNVNTGVVNPSKNPGNPVEDRPVTGSTGTGLGGGGLVDTAPPQPSAPPSSRIPSSPPPPPPSEPVAPTTGTTGGTSTTDFPVLSRPGPGSYTPNMGTITQDPTLLAQSAGRSFSSGSGPVLISDIRNKTNIQPLETKNPMLDAGLALGREIADRRAARIQHYNDMYARTSADYRPAPAAAPAEAQSFPAQASFEGGANPMMGMGAAPVQKTVSVPFDQALPTGTSNQAVVNVPFGVMSPNDIRDQQTAYFNQPFDPDKPGSDKRMKKDMHGYVSSPVEAKKDIRPVDMQGMPADYQDQWRGVSLQQAMEPPQERPMFSMTAPPIVPGRGEAPPAVDLRPAQGYSYDYKDPNAPGAKEGRQFGPMADDLVKTPAGRSVVSVNPETGMKQVDTSRLALVNTAAISEQQRKMDMILDMLDAANARAGKDTGSRYGKF